jgi:hypothetical protein
LLLLIKLAKMTMKKIIVLLTLMTSLYFAKAQSRVQFGLKAGANFSGWTGEQAAGSSLKPGFHAGGFASIPLNASLAFKPELFFSGEGIKTASASYAVDYIKVPILLQYRHSSGFQIETGPQLGLLLSAKLKSNGEEEDIKHQFLPLDASWATGFGYSLKSGLGFNLRYSFGLSKFASNEQPLRTAVISGGVSYVFGGR